MHIGSLHVNAAISPQSRAITDHQNGKIVTGCWCYFFRAGFFLTYHTGQRIFWIESVILLGGFTL